MLDTLDLALIAELDHNSRASFAELGRKLKALPETLRYRFQRLENEGVIVGCSAVIDSSYLGFTQLKLLIRLHSCSEEELASLIKWLKRHRKVMRIAVYDGEYDIGVVLKVNRLLGADDFVSQLLQNFGSIISRRSLSLNVWGQYLDRTYLSRKRVRQPGRGSYGERLEPIRQFRTPEREILRQLSLNARISGAELERKLRAKSEDNWLVSETILNQIRTFERERIITGYVLSLNLEAFGRFGLKVLLQLQPSGDLKAFVNACREFPEITHIVKALGQWDIELDFEVREYSDYRRILMKLSSRFKGLLRDTMVLRYLSVEKFQFYSGEQSVS